MRRYSLEGLAPAADRTVALDPLGRFLFLVGYEVRNETHVWSLDLRTGLPGPLAQDNNPGSRAQEPEGEFLQSRWLPPPALVWETVEAQRKSESRAIVGYAAWRLSLGATSTETRLVRAKVPKPSATGAGPATCLPKKPLPSRGDGPASTAAPCEQEPSGRFRGIDKQSVARVADNVVLTVDTQGCQYAGGAYSSVACGRKLHFRYQLPPEQAAKPGEQVHIGAYTEAENLGDPHDITLIRGDQLLPVLLRPSLAADFFSGRPLLPDAKQVLGRPPELLLLRDDSAAKSATRRLWLYARDGGDGVGGLRAFFQDHELTLPAQAALVSNRPRQLELALPANECGTLALYSCNRSGKICSLPVELPHCLKPAPAKAPAAGGG
jgi:hypothetical protein